MNKIIYLAVLLIALLSFSSCNKHSQLLYMQSGNSATSRLIPQDYKVGPKDELYVQISSLLNKDVNSLFSTNNSNSNNSQSYMLNSDAGIYINTYSVNDSGYIEVPLIGRIDVANKTLAQVTAEVKKMASEYVNDAIVVVKLMSFRVTVIGEVKRPAVITNYHDKLTILEAIAEAGDMTDFANRKSVTLIRNVDNETSTILVDLSSKDILSNPGYYLQPGDVIVVEPRKGKVTQLNLSTYSFMLSSVTTLILLLNFLK